MHSLIHLADDVEEHGVGLEKLSAFPFENELGHLKKMVHSGNNAHQQMVKRLDEHLKVNSEASEPKFVVSMRNRVYVDKNGSFVLVGDELDGSGPEDKRYGCKNWIPTEWKAFLNTHATREI